MHKLKERRIKDRSKEKFKQSPVKKLLSGWDTKVSAVQSYYRFDDGQTAGNRQKSFGLENDYCAKLTEFI